MRPHEPPDSDKKNYIAGDHTDHQDNAKTTCESGSFFGNHSSILSNVADRASGVLSAALLELLAGPARAGVVSADLGHLAHDGLHLLGLLLGLVEALALVEA